MNSLQTTLQATVVTVAAVYAGPSFASPMDICISMRQAIAPESGATKIGENSTSKRTLVANTFRLGTPLTIGGFQVSTLLEIGEEKGSSIRAAFRFPDTSAASAFGRGIAEQYGQSQSERSTTGTTFQVSLSKPFDSATTAVRGRNVQFYCSLG